MYVFESVHFHLKIPPDKLHIKYPFKLGHNWPCFEHRSLITRNGFPRDHNGLFVIHSYIGIIYICFMYICFICRLMFSLLQRNPITPPLDKWKHGKSLRWVRPLKWCHERIFYNGQYSIYLETCICTVLTWQWWAITRKYNPDKNIYGILFVRLWHNPNAGTNIVLAPHVVWLPVRKPWLISHW